MSENVVYFWYGLEYSCLFIWDINLYLEILIIENGKRYSSKSPLHYNGLVCNIICMKSVNDIKKNGNSLFFKSGHVPLSILILFVFQKHLVKQKNIISFADMKLFFLSTYAQSIFIDVIISMKLLNGIFLIFVVRVKFSVIEFWIRSLLLWFIVIHFFKSLLHIWCIV